jgi:hypothetical protein
MEKFRKVFGNKKVVLPVIHVQDLKQANLNVAIAREVGADGVFLINHEISCKVLLDIYQMVAGSYPDFWIGINLLGMGPFRVFDMIYGKGLRIQGIWTDNARIDESPEEEYQDEPERVSRYFPLDSWPGLYFGGVAFKYQRKVFDVWKAAKIAACYMDVVTTSGPATGEAPEIEKIRLMKQAIGEKPLAIASGITPDNVGDYLEADCFLVATGISKDFCTLDEIKARSLIEKVGQKQS